MSLDLAGTAYDGTSSFTYNPAGQIATRTGSNHRYAWTGHGNADRAYGVNGLNQAVTAGSGGIGDEGRGDPSWMGDLAYGHTSENRLATGGGAGRLPDRPDRP